MEWGTTFPFGLLAPTGSLETGAWVAAVEFGVVRRAVNCLEDGAWVAGADLEVVHTAVGNLDGGAEVAAVDFEVMRTADGACCLGSSGFFAANPSFLLRGRFEDETLDFLAVWEMATSFKSFVKSAIPPSFGARASGDVPWVASTWAFGF